MKEKHSRLIDDELTQIFAWMWPNLVGQFLGQIHLKNCQKIPTANYDLKFCCFTLKHKYVSALCHNIHFLVVLKWMSCLMRWYHRKNGQKCTSNGISRWYPMVNVCQYHISNITQKSLFLNQSNTLWRSKMPFLRQITAYYGILRYKMIPYGDGFTWIFVWMWVSSISALSDKSHCFWIS